MHPAKPPDTTTTKFAPQSGQIATHEDIVRKQTVVRRISENLGLAGRSVNPGGVLLLQKRHLSGTQTSELLLVERPVFGGSTLPLCLGLVDGGCRVADLRVQLLQATLDLHGGILDTKARPARKVPQAFMFFFAFIRHLGRAGF